MINDTIKDYEQPFTRYMVCCDEDGITGIAMTGYYDGINATWRSVQEEGTLMNQSAALEVVSRLQNAFDRSKDAFFICKVTLVMKRVAVKLEEV